MSETRTFCPSCGETVEVPEDVRTSRGQPALCDACYFEDFELVDAPDRLEVLYCGECGAVKRGKEWVDLGARDHTDIAVDAVSESLGVHVDAEQVSWRVDPEQVDQTTIRMHCFFSGIVRETPIEAEAMVPVKLATGTCDRCGRMAGDYYAAVVQVRAADRTPSDEELRGAEELAREHLVEREEEGNREAFITEISQTDDGLDMKLSTNELGRGVAQRIVTRFGGALEEYPTLVTEDEDGQEVYRVTFAVRLPPYRQGEIIDPEDGDGPVLVTSARGNLKGTRLRSGDRYEASYEDGDAPDARRLGDVDDAEETTLVAVEDDRAIQVLDPETYETKTIARPDFLDPDAETVPVIRHRDGVDVLPEDAVDQ
jgi:nonsense-mediated mRNA decay protein 3